MSDNPLLFRQLFDEDTYTYTYLIADPKAHEAALIDTVQKHRERDLKLVKELGLQLKYVMDTHVHADHITGAGAIREVTEAQTILGEGSGVGCADREMKDGEVLELGSFKIKVISTPGHTNSCVSYYVDGKVFTGDALLIRGCGRTDFQHGSSKTLYHSIKEKLFTLPPETVVFPAHDYSGMTQSTISEEMEFNPRLGAGKSLEDFELIMKNLNLATPKYMQMAVPANLSCGERK